MVDCDLGCPCSRELEFNGSQIVQFEDHFSVLTAVGFLSVFGVGILDGTILMTYIRQLRKEGLGLEEAVHCGAEMRIRPVLTGLAAAIGLLPAAVVTGIGAQTQQPLARVVVGGMLTAAVLILVVLPVLYSLFSRSDGAGLEPGTPPELPQDTRTGEEHVA